eukprot:m.228481 g.228481  ORF g.228481 m.228481 type:complete len:393 (-) comp25975_c1_seq11:1051-2229(-)
MCLSALPCRVSPGARLGPASQAMARGPTHPSAIQGWSVLRGRRSPLRGSPDKLEPLATQSWTSWTSLFSLSEWRRCKTLRSRRLFNPPPPLLSYNKTSHGKKLGVCSGHCGSVRCWLGFRSCVGATGCALTWKWITSPSRQSCTGGTHPSPPRPTPTQTRSSCTPQTACWQTPSASSSRRPPRPGDARPRVRGDRGRWSSRRGPTRTASRWPQSRPRLLTQTCGQPAPGQRSLPATRSTRGERWSRRWAGRRTRRRSRRARQAVPRHRPRRCTPRPRRAGSQPPQDPAARPRPWGPLSCRRGAGAPQQWPRFWQGHARPRRPPPTRAQATDLWPSTLARSTRRSPRRSTRQRHQGQHPQRPRWLPCHRARARLVGDGRRLRAAAGPRSRRCP